MFWRRSARLVLVYALVLAGGGLAAVGLSELAGLIIPSAKVPAFVILFGWWLWIGWRYSKIRDAAQHRIASGLDDRRVSEVVGEYIRCDSDFERNEAFPQNVAHPSFPIGKYKLDAHLEGVEGLGEFSETEYKIMGRTFVGEKNYNAPPVTFLNRSWLLQLQTVKAQIRKIGVYQLVKAKADANPIAMEALGYCIDHLGKPQEQKTGFFFWRTVDGNVILQTGDTRDGFAINLFLTASSVRNLQRVE